MKRGLAALSARRRKEIAKMGGTESQKKGKAYRFDSEAARKAGKKGGLQTAKNKAHLSRAGRKGGIVRQCKHEFDQTINECRKCGTKEKKYAERAVH